MRKSYSKKIECKYLNNECLYSRKYMKENDVNIMHLNVINSVFLDCDE